MAISRDQIMAAVSTQKSLPSVPDLVIRLEAELRKDEPSVDEVAKLMEQDPALSLKVLSVANSAFYSRGKAAATVRQAMMRLGFSEIRRMAVAALVVDNYRDFSGGSPALFWGHSLAVAFATRAVAEFCSCELTDDAVEAAFTCGLLHDLGIMAMGQLFPAEHQTLVARHLRDGGDFCDLEIDEFGIDHGEVGALMMRNWSLPDELVEVVAHHHSPWMIAPDNVMRLHLTQLVHLSDFICNNQGYGRRRQVLPASFDESAWESLGLTLDAVPGIIARVREEGGRSEVFMKAFG